jgi:FkbM family methyltransferase
MFSALFGALLAPAIFRQEVEDDVLDTYFSNRKPGYFIEVGAFDPELLSQSKRLEDNGWSGLMIEACEEHAIRCRKNRTSKVIQVACGSPAQHGTTMKLAKLGGLSTVRADRFENDWRYDEYEIVSVVTLDSILEVQQPTSIDFISIDVEGAEMDVLAGFDISRWKPPLVLIEDHIENDSIHRFMKAHGYKRVRRTGDNSWYVPSPDSFNVSLFGRWQLLRKYYLGRPLRIVRTRRWRNSLRRK